MISVADWRGDLLLPAGGYLLVRGKENGRHANPRYRAGRYVSFSAADECHLLGQQVPEVWNFGLFTIEKVGYQAQVIPALMAGLALGFIETRLKRIVPDYLYLVIVPVCSLILAVFLAHAFIGPVGA